MKVPIADVCFPCDTSNRCVKEELYSKCVQVIVIVQTNINVPKLSFTVTV